MLGVTIFLRVKDGLTLWLVIHVDAAAGLGLEACWTVRGEGAKGISCSGVA